MLNYNKDEQNLTHDEITAKLKEKCRGSNYLSRFINDEPYALTDSYINLVIVKQKEIEEKEKSLKNEGESQDKENKRKEFRDERLATYESLYQVSELIEIKDIFNKQDDKEIKKVLVYGRAGIGKSTLCKYLAVKWQEGNLWPNKFKAVIWLPLRELLNTKYKNSTKLKLEKVVKDKCMLGRKKPSNADIKKYIEENFKNLLFVLDGYDEIAQVIENDEYRELRTLLKDLLQDNNASVILTSRPISIRLEGEIIVFDKKLENTGFTNENIRQYVKRFYPENSQKLIKFLEQNKSIWGIAHIPINLDLICSIWDPSENTEKTEYTMSKLYIQINRKLLERYLEKVKAINLDNLSKGKYEKETSSLVENLERLAIYGMENNQLIIPSAEVKKVNQEALETVLKSGLIKTIGSKRYEKDIYFLHLTFQEFYAASNIARSLGNIGSKEYRKAKELIAEHKYNPYYQVMWWFVAGILYENGKEKDDYLALIRFWDAIESHPRTLVGFSHVNLVIKCLDECRADEKVVGIKELIISLIPYINNWIVKNREFDNPYKSIQVNLAISPYLIKTEQVTTTLGIALKNNNKEVRRVAVWGLFEIGANIPEIVSKLSNVLKDSDKEVRRTATYVLGIIGANTPEVVSGLLVALKDNDKEVRKEAARALGKIEANSPEVVSGLLVALKDNDEKVRKAAEEALSIIGANTLEVVSGLVVALKDNNKKAKKYAARALGKIGANSPEVISGLLDALKDNDANVIYAVAETLGKIGANSPEVISGLLDALKDNDANVRYAAAGALGKIEASISEVISILFDALKDNNKKVRKEAVWALGKIGANSPEVISGLLIALKDNEGSVRSAAAWALGKIGTSTPEVVFGLLIALKDNDENVRSAAAGALGIIGVSTPEVVFGLLEALRDNNEWVSEGDWVRYSMVWALGKIGANTLEVVPILLDALKGNVEGVRYEAAWGLGIVGANSPEVISILLDASKDNDKQTREAAVMALGRIGANTPEVVFGLLNALKDNVKGVREAAVETLNKISVNTPEVVSGLLDALKDSDKNIRHVASITLNKIGVNTSEVVSRLLDALKNNSYSYYWVKKAAEEALGKIEVNTPEVVSGLLDALKDNDENIRYVLSEILNRILANSRLIKKDSTAINTIAIALKNCDKEVEFIQHHIPSCNIKIKCYAISGNQKWLNELLLSDSIVILNKEKNIVFIKYKSTKGEEILLSTEQVSVLLNILEKEAKKANLSTNVYDYYKDTGKFNFSDSLVFDEGMPKYEEKSWHFDPAIKAKTPVLDEGQVYKLIEGSEKDKEKVVSCYQHHPVPGYDIGKVEIIYIPRMNREFSLYIARLQERYNNKVFIPTWQEEKEEPVKKQWRRKIGELFEDMAQRYVDKDCPKVKILPLWHGTSREIIDSLFKTGYVNLATTDGGYFGDGIYFTHYAEYAYKVYSHWHGENGCLLLNWVACFSAYPFIDGDMDKLEGVNKQDYKKYDGRFIPVKPVKKPYGIDYKATTPNQGYTYTELVVFQSAACLPRYLVTLEPIVAKMLPYVDTIREYINYNLAEGEIIHNNLVSFDSNNCPNYSELNQILISIRPYMIYMKDILCVIVPFSQMIRMEGRIDNLIFTKDRENIIKEIFNFVTDTKLSPIILNVLPKLLREFIETRVVESIKQSEILLGMSWENSEKVMPLDNSNNELKLLNQNLGVNKRIVAVDSGKKSETISLNVAPSSPVERTLREVREIDSPQITIDPELVNQIVGDIQFTSSISSFRATEM